MCKAAEITQNQMTLMCEDEDKTVIKRRGAQGSKSKRLRNLKNGSGRAETSAADNTGGSLHKQAVCGAPGEREPALETTPLRPLSLQGSPSYPGSRAGRIGHPHSLVLDLKF